jgi:hypothetical protein
MYVRTAMQHPHISKGYSDYQEFLVSVIKARWLDHKPNWNTLGNVYAYVNWSNWKVACPFCPEVVLAEPGYAYYCPNCLMAGNGNRAMDIIFPPDKEIIDALLNMRPSPENRHWELVETSGDLIDQNVKNGIM